MLAVQAVLNLHQLLKVVLRNGNKKIRRGGGTVQNRGRLTPIRSLTPCFMMSFAWLATSFTTLSAAVRRGNVKHQWTEPFSHQTVNTTDPHRSSSHFVCLYNPQSPRGDSSDNLKKEQKIFFYSKTQVCFIFFSRDIVQFFLLACFICLSYFIYSDIFQCVKPR